MKKGTNKARVAGYLDIFGEDDSTSANGAGANVASPNGGPDSGPGTPLPDPEPLLAVPDQAPTPAEAPASS